jgi:streptomycin 6-kinase
VTATAAPAEPLERLGLLLDRALRALGNAGEDDAAARLAAEAWWLLRGPSPGAAQRLNATLHYLTLRPTKGRTTDVHRP